MTKNGFQALEIEIIQRTGSTSVVLSSPKVHNASILAQIMLALAIFNLLIGNFQMIWGFIAVLIVGSHRPLSKLLAKQVSQALQFNENQ